MPPTRRRLLRTTTGLITSLATARAMANVQTPRAAEGPFYPRPSMRPDNIDNDLVRVSGQVQHAGGAIVRLTGRIKNAAGEPQPGLRIEIWQCDAQGRYLHTSDRQAIVHDTGFQGFGHDITDTAGTYRFRTIKPVAYPGRTPHIHVKVLDGSRERLTTQFYLKDHPANARDVLYRRLSGAQAAAVDMVFDETQPEPVAQVNIVV